MVWSNDDGERHHQEQQEDVNDKNNNKWAKEPEEGDGVALRRGEGIFLIFCHAIVHSGLEEIN